MIDNTSSVFVIVDEPELSLMPLVFVNVRELSLNIADVARFVVEDVAIEGRCLLFPMSEN